ncbi:NDP-sugar synthase [Streptomyces buecherae]|uniref:NDP-sugar synthase n=1 Tax=Streptomyces buecherae TaxID=2763006 RepID=UPI0037913E62
MAPTGPPPPRVGPPVLRQLAVTRLTSRTLAIGHLGHTIRACVGNGSQWGPRVGDSGEDSPLGTMGPLLSMLDQLPERFLVMNGDILTDLDLDLDFGDVPRTHATSGAPLTIAAYARQVNIDFGVLTTEWDRVVVGLTEKPRVDCRVSTGVYGVSRDTLDPYTPGLRLGFDELVLDPLKAETPPHAYDFDGYWLDIGRPDAYDRANAEFTQRHGVLIKGA